MGLKAVAQGVTAASIADGTLPGSFTTLASSGLFTPSQTAGIAGTTTNNSVQAGSIGEFIDSAVASVSVASASITNVTSITLTAGDWDIAGVVQYNGTSGVTRMSVSISTTTASNAGTVSAKSLIYAATDTVTGTGQGVIPRYRVSLAGTTIYYLNAQLAAAGPQNCDGYISARRIR